ncbi:MAG: hypothetical protein M1839_008214 [Geoglossum umbratile]|nr:MAG: hypothetical protein M1839_008214 [Geoglossum umbratile]
MPSLSLSPSYLLPALFLLVFFTRPAHAFGAGNIASLSKIEGSNWRHGDIEDTLLTLLISRAAGGKKFSKMDVKRVYFGNWLRDYSQAVDVGTVKYVSAEAVRILLWVLGFLTFGYATKEFEVTTERLGCYRPEEHIDNPKDYADNLDARQYDTRLRGPVDERRELSVNPQTGLKNYIASEGIGITTSAELVRNLFGRSIQLGRQYARSKNKADLYEALRLLGTGCHCLEDFSAHSNYTELALIELGERNVFPHVGRRTMVTLPNRATVYPIVTGTFGGTDFLHSVMGEFDDKATQSEIQVLEGTIQDSQNSGKGQSSILRDILDKLPTGLFGSSDDVAGKADELEQTSQAAQFQQARITPRRPEEWTRQIEEVQKQIYPILEWHDELMQNISEAIEKIPVLPELIEQATDEINIFVFSLLAPFVLPIINQVKEELATGSSEIIQSSKDKQHVVFHDDHSSDPTHSMLSKDHFSNILNEPAGKVASAVLKWVVPQLISCWDDERADVNRTLDRIVAGIFHHPSLRDYGDDGAADGRRAMFAVLEQWWREKNERDRDFFRDALSREGIQAGRNHKEGVHDSGHGCGKPLAMSKHPSSSSALGGPGAGALLGGLSDVLGGGSGGYGGKQSHSGGGEPYGQGVSKLAGEAVGGGAIGGIVGGILGTAGAELLGDAFGGEKEKKSHSSHSYGDDGSYTQSYVETGHRKDHGGEERYGQAKYSQTAYSGGGGREEYSRYEQEGGSGHGRSGYGYEEGRETRPTYGGGYEQTTAASYERTGGGYGAEVRTEGRTAGGEYYSETKAHESSYGEGSYGGQKETESEEEARKKREKKEKKEKKEKGKKKEKKHKEYGYGEEGREYGEESEEEEEEGYKESRGYGESKGYGESGDYGESREYGESRDYRESRDYGYGGGYERRNEEEGEEEREY